MEKNVVYFCIIPTCVAENPLDSELKCFYHNFFATWAMGPMLARNPSMLRELLHRLLGEDYRECDMRLEEKALALVTAEFDKK